jgi:hypothetical protein
VRKPFTAQQTIQGAVETLCYDYLDETHGGWGNNDGGFGGFRLDVAEFNRHRMKTFMYNSDIVARRDNGGLDSRECTRAEHGFR